MLKKMLYKIIEWVVAPTRGNSELDRFISSKNPKNAAEIDYWVRIYDQSSTRNWI